MKLVDVAKRFQKKWAALASSTYVSPIPVDSQIGVEDGRASLDDGFPPVTFQPVGAGGTPPFGKDMNGIFSEITNAIRWTQAGGNAIYDATFSAAIGGYANGAVVASATTPMLMWMSTADDNTTDPDAGGANWIPIFNAMYFVDTGAASAIQIAMPGMTTYPTTGFLIAVKVKATNVGATTLQVNGLAAKAATYVDLTPLLPNAITTDGVFLFAWDGTRFQVMNPVAAPSVKWRLTANTNYYVNPVTGNNAFNGLTAGTAWQTLTYAYAWLQKNVDASGFQITINCAFPNNPTNYAPMVANGSVTGVFSRTQLAVVGDMTNSRCAISQSSTGLSCVSATDGAQFSVAGFTLTAPGTQCSGVTASGGARVHLGTAMNIGSCSTYQVVSQGSGSIISTTNGPSLQLSGTCVACFAASSAAQIDVQSLQLNLSAGVTCSSAVMQATNTATILVGSSMTFIGSATGLKYNITSNGIVDTNGAQAGNPNYLPGSLAGTTASGGQIV